LETVFGNTRPTTSALQLHLYCIEFWRGPRNGTAKNGWLSKKLAMAPVVLKELKTR